MNKQLWRIQLLGGLEARQGEHSVSRFRTRKTGALLAYLALYGERAHSRETVLDLLWPDSDLVAARNSLSVALTSLRRQFEPAEATNSAPALGTVVVADRATLRLRPGTFTTDVAAFEAALREADEHNDADTDRRLALLADAVTLYAGELLPGYYDDWAVAERERLADAYLQALRTLTSLYMGARDFERALDCAHRAVQADPLSEESRRLLIRLYAILGRPATGLEQFRDLERRRADEGEAPPSEDTRRLTLRLAEGTDKETGGGPNRPRRRAPRVPGQDGSSSQAAPLPSAASAVAAPVNLPLRFDRFFGRSEELARLELLFSADDTRLITLIGPGGAGKTRLAIEAAARARDLFGAAGGIFFVPLADVTDAAWIPDAIVGGLDLPGTPSATPLDQIASALADRQCLIVLDNIEHLLSGGPLDSAGAAAVVRTLRARLPGLRLMVTSRRRLGLDGEREFPVAPLPVPGNHVISPGQALEYPGVQMFVDRARARRVDFQVTEGNVAAVSALCARLEGIPLALELAAAWSKLLTPAQMADRLTDRVGLLVSRRRDVPKRHRTLRAAIEWGYDLLSPDARRLYPLLSAFRGDWSVGDAQAVCEAADPAFQGRTLAALTELRDASFIVAAERNDAREMRLRLLETLREFADELLAPEARAALEKCHAGYFLARAEEAAAHLRGPEQTVFFDRLEADHDNLRAVLDRTADSETGLLLAGALAYFWKMRGHYQEGSAWFARVLSAGSAAAQTASAARARALKGAGNLAYDRADYASASDRYARSLEMYRVLNDAEGMAAVLINLGNVAYRGGDGDRARLHYSEALTYYRSRNDRWGIASALGSLGNVAQAGNDFDAARAFQEESLAISREIGDERMTAYTLHNLGNLAVEQGDGPTARVFFEDSLVRKRTLGDRRGVAALLASIGYLELQDGAGDQAREPLTEALRLAWELGDRLGTVTALDGLAWHASFRGDTRRAARLWAASEAEREARSLPPSELQKAQFVALIADARAATTPTGDFDSAWVEGRALALESAVESALSDS